MLETAILVAYVKVLQEIIELCVFNFVMIYATVFKFQIE